PALGQHEFFLRFQHRESPDLFWILGETDFARQDGECSSLGHIDPPHLITNPSANFRRESEGCQRSHIGGDCKTPELFPAVDGRRFISDSVFMSILSKPPGNKSCRALVSSLKGSSALATLDDHCVGEGQETT